MTENTQLSPGVNPASTTPDHLQIDRAEFDRRIAQRRASPAGGAAPESRDRERPPATSTGEATACPAPPPGAPAAKLSAHDLAELEAVLATIPDLPFPADTGTGHPSRGAPLSLGQAVLKSVSSRVHGFKKRYIRSPDREASRRRRRGWSNNMPPEAREEYTEGERAVGTVIASEVKRHGIMDWCNDRIAAVAGACLTTVHNFLRKAAARGDISIQHRPVPGAKNLTNIITIAAKGWLRWIKRGPIVPPIGCMKMCPTTTKDSALEVALQSLGAAVMPSSLRRLINALELK